MSSDTETIVFGGSGSENPSLKMWSKLTEDAKPLIVSQFSYDFSIYALAISPSGTRIAVGTKQGLLRVHALSGFRASENSPALFEIYHRPFVTSLAFLTDDILASGSLNGNIKLWSVSEKCQLAEFPAHPKGVIALRRLGSLVLASIGRDKVLRIWDMDTMEAKYESPPFILPKIYALTSLDCSFISGLLMHPSGNGDLHLYDPYNDFTKRIVHAHDGDFCALACGSEYVVTAGLSDTMIKLWPSSMDEPLAEVSAPLGCWTVSWAGTSSIITAYTDGSSQVWNLDGRLSPGPRYNNLDLRTTIGLPVDLMARNLLETNKQWCDNKLARAKEIIADSGGRKEISTIIDGLRQKGFSVEAMLVLADAAKAQNKPLWELECRLTLVKELGDNSTALPLLYALGKLLRRLKEPKLAQDCFKKILQTDRDYFDVNEQIAGLESDSLIQLCPEKDIRGDLMKKGRFLQELEKHTILNKKFSWRSVIKIEKAFTFKVRLSSKDVADSVSTAIEKSKSDACSTGLEQVLLFYRGRLKEITWMYVLSTKKNFPITFALEIHSTTRGAEFIPYKIFDTKQLKISTEISANEHNQQVENAWNKFRASDDTMDWLSNIYNISNECIKQLARKKRSDKGKSGKIKYRY